MFRGKLHKWFYSLAVLAMLVSYSSYANTTTHVVNNTEWLDIKTSDNNTSTYYIDYYIKKEYTNILFSFYVFHFSSLLNETDTQSYLRFLTQKHRYINYKTEHLLKLFTPHQITNIVCIDIV